MWSMTVFEMREQVGNRWQVQVSQISSGRVLGEESNKILGRLGRVSHQGNKIRQEKE